MQGRSGRCYDHPDQFHPCPFCRGRRGPTPDELQAIRQTLAEAPDLSDKAAREQLAKKETQ